MEGWTPKAAGLVAKYKKSRPFISCALHLQPWPEAIALPAGRALPCIAPAEDRSPAKPINQQHKEECLISTDIEWLALSMVIALAASFFNYKNTLVNFSFARMRKKYIEDNDEQDPELIKKVAPFYQRTSQILGGKIGRASCRERV